MLSIGVSFTFFQSASAAYTRPVGWTDMKAVDLQPVVRAQFATQSNLHQATFSESVIDYVLRDADHKVNKEFQIPSEIKSSTGFWLRIYTQYSTQQVVLFDANHMDTIYEVLDFRELAQKSKSQMMYEIVSNNRLTKALSLYKKAFAALAKNPRPKNPTREQKNILAQHKDPKHRQSFLDLEASFKVMRGQRDNIVNGLLAAESFFPKMEMIFSRMNVPKELTRISLVESSFNLRATSKVGASGVWQFMPHIGKKYLTINDQMEIDERRSPLKSTAAAAKMLRWNQHYLGSWPLAIIAYNHGLKNLPKLKDKSADFSKIAYLFQSSTGKKKPPLGWASRSYYAEFLAVLYAETYRKIFYGDIPHGPVRPMTFQQLTKSESAITYAMEKAISLKEFSSLNADIENIRKPLPKGFWVAVPGESDNITEFVDVALGKKKSSHQHLASHVTHHASRHSTHHSTHHPAHASKRKKHHA